MIYNNNLSNKFYFKNNIWEKRGLKIVITTYKKHVFVYNNSKTNNNNSVFLITFAYKK